MASKRACELAYDGNLNELKLILKEDTTLQSVTDQSGRNPLHWAISGGHGEIVDFIFQFFTQIPVDSRDDANWTPLMIASSAGRLQIVKDLISKEAQVNAVNSTGQTPLHYAASKDHYEIAEVLLENGADPNAADSVKNTPLHRSTSKGHGKITKLLLSYNADPNYQDSTGNTPLHLACEENFTEIAKLLVDQGGCINTPNKAEKTPLNLAPPQLKRALEHQQEQMDIMSYVQ